MRKTSAEYQKAYRERHPGREKENGRRAYQRARALINELKSKPCADCGKLYPPCVMDFDHRDPKQKRFNVSEAIRSRAVTDEASKCDVICSNCHRIRTHIKKLK